MDHDCCLVRTIRIYSNECIIPVHIEPGIMFNLLIKIFKKFRSKFYLTQVILIVLYTYIKFCLKPEPVFVYLIYCNILGLFVVYIFLQNNTIRGSEPKE